MAYKAKNYEIDMCTGNLVGKMLLFTLPLIATGILQLLFNTADMIVAGKFAGPTALASVSGTASLTNLIVNLFIGLSVGANVCVAKFYAQNNEQEVSETVHTAVVISVIFGIILAVFGFFMARPLLTLMKTPDTVIDGAVTYMRIYFLGMPVIMLYNFTSAILRAVGDTKRPLYYLMIAGVINVLLNLFFVIVLGIGVAGVAIATVASQAISAGLVLHALFTYDGCLKLEVNKLKISGKKLLQMVRIGLPAGIQGSFFSISNVLIQSSINSFGDMAMAGNAAAQNIEGYVYVAMNAFHHTTLSFTSQNYGGGKYDRIIKVVRNGLLFVMLVGLALGSLAFLLKEPLLDLFVDHKPDTPREEIIGYGIIRMTVIMFTYFTCGTMDVLVGGLRGLGKSIPPMLITLAFVCGFRILWIFTVFSQVRSLECLYTSYPVSWTLATFVQGAYFVVVYRRIMKRIRAK